MKTTTRWTTVILFLMTLMLTACASGGGIDLSKFPIVIAPAPPTPAPVVTPPVVRATLAFEVLDEQTGAPIPTAFATCDDGIPKQATEAGYIAVERDLGIYSCTFEADDYETVTRRYQLEDNRQFPVKLKSTKPAPPLVVVIPAPPVVVPPAPVVPPVVVPPAPPSSPLCHMRDSDPLGCVRQVAAVFPQLLLTNTINSCVEFVQRVLEVLGPDWGHVGKARGMNGAPRGFVPIEVSGYRIIGVAVDAIKHRSGQVIDILGNATANEPRPAICAGLSADDPRWREHCWAPGPAQIGWEVVPAHDWRPENPFVPAVPVR